METDLSNLDRDLTQAIATCRATSAGGMAGLLSRARVAIERLSIAVTRADDAMDIAYEELELHGCDDGGGKAAIRRASAVIRQTMAAFEPDPNDEHRQTKRDVL